MTTTTLLSTGHSAIQIGRLLDRAYNRRVAPMQEFFAADRQFDGGEWSDAFHADAEESLWNHTLAEFERFLGVPAQELNACHYDYLASVTRGL
jgi:hypothetical protein